MSREREGVSVIRLTYKAVAHPSICSTQRTPPGDRHSELHECNPSAKATPNTLVETEHEE